jgi:membrane protease YdiL (CAAX protease family)
VIHKGHPIITGGLTILAIILVAVALFGWLHATFNEALYLAVVLVMGVLYVSYEIVLRRGEG